MDGRLQWWLWWAVLGVFTLDRALKYRTFHAGSASLNENIAFSIQFPKSLLTVTIVVIIVLLVFAAVRSRKSWDAFGYGIIAIGAVSNLIDRFWVRSVVDYIQFWIIPIFNLSDVLIVCGVVWLLSIRSAHR